MEGIKFEKVSFEQFYKDISHYLGSNLLTEEEAKDLYDHIKLPKRSTKSSAGYDFYSPIGFKMYKGKEVQGYNLTIPTGIRVKLPENYFLMIAPRSGIGFKTGIHLANTVGIIDADYYNSDNEGHIMVKYVAGFEEKVISAGDGFVQGIIMKYYTTEDDEADGIRNGGFGSTDKK